MKSQLIASGEITLREMWHLFSSLSSACISPGRLNDKCSISQLSGCDVWRETGVDVPVCSSPAHVRVRVCICLNFYRHDVSASSQWPLWILGLLIMPCSQPSCCLHVTMETLLLLYISQSLQRRKCSKVMVLRESVCHFMSLPFPLHWWGAHCSVVTKEAE